MSADARADVRAAVDELVDVLLRTMASQRGAEAPNRLLSVREAADYLGVGRTALYGLLASGEVRSMRVGRRRLVPAAAIDEYIGRGNR